MAMKQLQNISPPIMKQVMPLVEQLPPLYMDLANGREEFSPKPEETRRLVSYFLHLELLFGIHALQSLDTVFAWSFF